MGADLPARPLHRSRQPWKLAKDPDEAAQKPAGSRLYTAAEALRIITALAVSCDPGIAVKIWRQLGMPQPLDAVHLTILTGGAAPGQR